MAEHEEDGFSHHCPKCNHHNPTMCVVTGQVKGLKAIVANVQRQLEDRYEELLRHQYLEDAARRLLVDLKNGDHPGTAIDDIGRKLAAIDEWRKKGDGNG